MILFDSNILIHARNLKDKKYKECMRLLEMSARKEIEGAISSQNILEFAAVMHNQAEVFGNINNKITSSFLKNFQSGYLKIIYPNKRTLKVFNELVRTEPSRNSKKVKRKTFDTFLAATMISNNVKDVITYNKKDFEGFSKIRAYHPKDI